MLINIVWAAGATGVLAIYAASYSLASVTGRDTMSLGLRRLALGPEGRHAARHRASHAAPVVELAGVVTVDWSPVEPGRYQRATYATASWWAGRSWPAVGPSQRHAVQQVMQVALAVVAAFLAEVPAYLARVRERVMDLTQSSPVTSGH